MAAHDGTVAGPTAQVAHSPVSPALAMTLLCAALRYISLFGPCRPVALMDSTPEPTRRLRDSTALHCGCAAEESLTRTFYCGTRSSR